MGQKRVVPRYAPYLFSYRNQVVRCCFQMVRKRERTIDRQSWSLQSMTNAVTAVISGSMGYLKDSKLFGIPQTTLERRVKE
jgi:hypothetical protein